MGRSVKVKLNNPSLLTWARESAGYGLGEIAGYLGKSVEDVHAWETGSDAPTYRQLQKFARKVHRPVAALFLPEVPGEPPPPEDLRMVPGPRRGDFTPEARLAFRELRNSMAELRALLDDLHRLLGLSLPSWPGPHEPAAPRAVHLRELLGVTVEAQMGWRDEYQALNEWRDVLFDVGVLVQAFQVSVETVRAFSELGYGLGGVGISSKDSPRGRIFSVFHEVAHLCLRMPGVSGRVLRRATGERAATIEPYCDGFAAAFLLPAADPHVSAAVDGLGRNFTLERARRCARQFHVSKYVVARRLFDLGKIEPDRYWTEIDAWGAEDARIAAADARRRREQERDSGPSHVTLRVNQAGKRYVATVMEALQGGLLTTHEAAKVLSLRPESLADAQAIAFSA